MEIKGVKVTDGESRSAVEVEKELVQKHEDEIKADNPPVASVVDHVIETVVTKAELTEDEVLSFIKTKTNREVKSLDEFNELLNQPKVEVPEDVAAFLKYKKETGRTWDDYQKLQRDFTTVDPKKLIRDFYKESDPTLSDREIEFKMKKFNYDEEIDDEDEVIEKQLELKQELNKATKHFESLKEQYKAPLVSTGGFVSDEDKESYEAYKKYKESSQASASDVQKRSTYFAEKTNEVLSDNFEGFNFTLGEEKVTFKPADGKTLREKQSNVENFLNQFVDENGLIKDAEKYHKTLAAAADIDKFFEFAYNQGKAAGVADISKDSKNIDMGGVKSQPEGVRKDGMTVRVVDAGNEASYKIKSKKQ
jgi:hypothetical protein